MLIDSQVIEAKLEELREECTELVRAFEENEQQRVEIVRQYEICCGAVGAYELLLKLPPEVISET